MSSSEIQNQNKILHEYVQNPNVSGSSIAKKLKLPKSTVCRAIKRIKETNSVTRRHGGGRKPGPVNKDLDQKLRRSLKQNPGLSDADRAARYNTSRTNVRKTRIRLGIKAYKSVKVPNRNDKQNLVAKSRARLLYDKFLTKFEGCILMDDETYVKADFNQLPGSKFYYSTMRGNVPAKYKFVMHDKFAAKFMIWQAICTCGLRSQVFVTKSTMNADLYIKECLQKRILPLIRSHRNEVMFWPDLASCHYAKLTLSWFEANNVAFIKKYMNPPNCPEFRPIERYWAIVKRILKKNGGTVKDINAMKIKWNQQAAKVTDEGVRTLMSHIKQKVRDFIRCHE